MQQMTLGEVLEESGKLSEWFQVALHEHGTLEHGRRSAIALAFASLALDHREAFLLLVTRGARATAMAVTRPTLEAYVRALWAYELATDHQLQAFLQTGRYDPSVESTLQALRRKARPNGEMFEALRKHYGVLNDYAHGGGRQISRWLHASGVEPKYSDEQMMEAVRFVDVVGVLAGHAREKVCGHPTDAFVTMLETVIQRLPGWAARAP